MEQSTTAMLGSPDGIPLVRLTDIWTSILGEKKEEKPTTSDKILLGLAIRKYLPTGNKNFTKKEFIEALAMAHFTSKGSLRASFEKLVSSYGASKNIAEVMESVGITDVF